MVRIDAPPPPDQRCAECNLVYRGSQCPACGSKAFRLTTGPLPDDPRRADGRGPDPRRRHAAREETQRRKRPQ